MKHIAKFRHEPYGWLIDLDDADGSLVVNERTGEILLHEGDGDDRFHGALISPEDFIEFAVERGVDDTCEVTLHFGEDKLHALGTTGDVERAHWWVRNANEAIGRRGCQIDTDERPRPRAAAHHDSKKERAFSIISSLRDNHHYTNKRIAYEVAKSGYVNPAGLKGVNQSTISRLGDLDSNWSVNDSLLHALEDVASGAMEKNLSATLNFLSFDVIDYSGVPSAPDHLEQVQEAVKRVFRSLPASPLSKLPDGIDGVLVSLGGEDSGIFVVLVDSDLPASRRKIVAHELDHIAIRLRDTSGPSPDNDSDV